MRELIKHIHLWLSLPAGIFIVLMCLTGAILVFQQEIQKALSPEFYFTEVPAEGKKLPLDTLAGIAAEELAMEDMKISSMTVYSDPEATVAFGVTGQKGAFLTIDPYTAAIAGKGAPGGEFFTKVRGLHRWLLLQGSGRQTGRMIMGISSILLSVILISGIWIAVPRAWKKFRQWKSSFTFTGRKGARAWWFTSHRALGWYCAVFLLCMSLTGPMWSFSWYREAVASLFGATRPENGNTPERSSGNRSNADRHHSQPSASGINTVAWENALSGIMKEEPRLVSATFTRNAATVRTERHHARASDTYLFDEDGHITSVQKYEDLPSSRKYMGYAFIIHTGQWGGWTVKFIYLLACLGGAYLVISGYWLYIRRISKK